MKKKLLIQFKMLVPFDLVIPQPILRKQLEMAKGLTYKLSIEILLIKQNIDSLNSPR